MLILSFTSLLILFILSSCSSGVNDFSYEEIKVEVANKYKIDTSNFISRNANLNDLGQIAVSSPHVGIKQLSEIVDD